MHFLRKTESTGLPQSGHIDREGVASSDDPRGASGCDGEMNR
ncbi:MAG: hypothetical protein RLZZ592_1152 [Pseudomonadota bacterium]|jgi:hypothetical protein|nr:hypothetical protein [Pseudomonadota bacterium]